MEKKKKVYILDTSAVLINSDVLTAFEENDVAVPIQVLMELDNHKKGTDSINYNAREALRKIDSFSKKAIYDGGASLGEGKGKLRVIVGFPYHGEVKKIFPEQTMDHLILNAAYSLLHSKKYKDSGVEVILVSKDVNLRLKAGALGIQAEDYRNDIVPNANSLYQGVQKLHLSSDEISKLYENKRVNFDTQDLYQNEFIIIDDGNGKTALGCYKNNQIHLVSKEGVNPFGVKPMNAEQAFAFYALLDPNISLITIVGKAGTGKTLLALAAGLNSLKNKIYSQLYFTREAMGISNKEIGFLPGGISDKLSPYMKGVYDNLSFIKNLGNRDTIDKYVEDNKVVLEAITYLRGRSIPGTFFIIDEAQNLTHLEIKAIITRAGEGSKFIILGDITQIDTPYLDENSNGLSHVISTFRGQDIYAHIVLKKSERSYLAELAGDLL